MPNRVPLQLCKLHEKEFPLIKKLTREQEDLVNKLFKTKRVIVDSIAGSGKTVVSTQAMIALQKKGYIDKIYYVVFPVQEGALGFLPGEVKDKIKEYAVPFIQALAESGVDQYELDLERICDESIDGKYKVVPHTFLRGRTVNDAGIILDEAQNGTLDELQKSFTRITDSCYLVIAGHEGQTDIPIKLSGLARYKHHFKQGIASGEYTKIEFAHLSVNFRGDFSTFSDKVRQSSN